MSGSHERLPDQLEGLLAQKLKEREDGGNPLSEEQIQQLRTQLFELFQNGVDPLADVGEKKQKIIQMKEALAGGAREELSQMNAALGLPGALALFGALLDACDLTPKRREYFRKKICLPKGLKKEPIATMKIDFDNLGFHLLLHGGAAPSNHDLEAEFAKLPISAEERPEDIQTIKDQMGFLIYFTRGVYMQLLELNEPILRDLKTKLKGITPSDLGVDDTNTTLYLMRKAEAEQDVRLVPAGGDVTHEKLEPRFGLFLTKKENDK